TGVDFSSIAIDQATQRYPQLRFLKENWLEIRPEQFEIFDIVFSSNTLEHFHNPYEVLNKISGHAKKAIILALPYKEL
ncbi:class I SAM-dependent methyltransferase, partial [Acinetobacter baumannii]